MAITQIKFRHGTSQEWSSFNPVLAVAEPGYDTTTSRFKIGNGISTWSALAYSSADGAALTALVNQVDASVAAANAAVVAANAQSGSSTREQVNGLAGLDSTGKLYEARYATRLSQANLDALKARANHTGVQTAATISDFTAAVNGIINPGFALRANLGADQYFTTLVPAQPLTGLGVSVLVQATTDTFLVNWSIFVENLANGAWGKYGLFIDGVDQNQYAWYCLPSGPVSVASTYTKTGLSVGSHTFDIRMSLDRSANQLARGNSSVLTVVRVV